MGKVSQKKVSDNFEKSPVNPILFPTDTFAGDGKVFITNYNQYFCVMFLCSNKQERKIKKEARKETETNPNKNQIFLFINEIILSIFVFSICFFQFFSRSMNPRENKFEIIQRLCLQLDFF